MSEAETLPRDVRVDQLGLVSEWTKLQGDTLKTQLKVRMSNDEIDRVRGDLFEGLLVQSMTTTVDPAKLLKLYADEKITRAQLLSCLTVKKEPLEQFLSGDQIAKLGETRPASPQLRVTRIKGVEVKLLTAVEGLGAALRQLRDAAA